MGWLGVGVADALQLVSLDGGGHALLLDLKHSNRAGLLNDHLVELIIEPLGVREAGFKLLQAFFCS